MIITNTQMDKITDEYIGKSEQFFQQTIDNLKKRFIANIKEFGKDDCESCEVYAEPDLYMSASEVLSITGGEIDEVSNWEGYYTIIAKLYKDDNEEEADELIGLLKINGTMFTNTITSIEINCI